MSNIFKFIGNERGDSICEEEDGCPTEMAVLKRYWRETQATKNEVNSTEEVDNLTEMLVSASVPYEDSPGMQLSLVGRVKWYLNFNTNKLREQVSKLKSELKSIDGALNDPRANLTLTTSEIIWELKGQVEKLTKERDELVNAIDNEMVVTHMGVFNAGDDPKVALNKICCYAQDLGKFFAEDACKEQLAALAEQNEKLRVALQAMVDEAFARNCGLKIADDALSLPDLASPILNRYRAEGAPHD